MAKFFKRAFLCLMLMLIALGLVAFFAHRSAQTGPEFYQEAMKMDVTLSDKAGDELEKQIIDLHNEVLHEDQWSTTFTQQQINGWLASDLPSKFQKVLPHQVSDPRVSITRENMQVAFRYNHPKISGIVNLKASAFISEDGNEVGVVIESLNAGIVPLPISRFTDKISERAAAKGVPIRWAQKDGDPVIMFRASGTLPDNPDRKLNVHTIELQDGAIRITGDADAPAKDVEQSFHGYALKYFGIITPKSGKPVIR